MHQDTRKLLITGAALLGTGLFCVLMLFIAFGGAGHQGPHTNGGWLMLIIALGCIPMGVLVAALGLAKLIGERTAA